MATSRMAAGLVYVMAMLLCADAGLAQVEVTLPAEGSYRAGHFMPVRIRINGAEQPGELTILADGAIPTHVRLNGQHESVVPLLVLSQNLQPIRIVDARGREQVPVLPPLLLAPGDAKADFLQDERTAGPCSALAGNDAYAPTFSWRPGLPWQQRVRIVQVGVLIAIVALACTLLRGRRAAVCLLMAGALASSGIALWRGRTSDMAIATGTIIVDRVQTDRWTYFANRSASAKTACAVRLTSSGIPVFVDAAQALAIDARLSFDAVSGQLAFECSLAPGARAAVLDRRHTGTAQAAAVALPITSLDPVWRDSPMIELARRCYVDRNISMIGTIPSEPDPDFPGAELWPGVLLRGK